ncbi:cytochrome c oxidase accessory protein FixG [Flexibacter flexilis DSM 6793]|uniref:Cytochrome c oxidase accessory protein FixG n=1 Tax=Flexibacter flexilis DSM 6793 TaxID=927664 RepID=A0A1I1NWD0_9BACT|nr:cytochrome c oxidase accessory protein CcoG [Flexibacter flexilis]SFC99033.1 cytochrome c oxidase accessory protein FixG [Flexibacter flexilis DSM 6793]
MELSDKKQSADDEFWEDSEMYRDAISTVDANGKRIWLYPKKPTGDYTNKRIWFSGLLLIILFAVPFVSIHGRPLLRFNIFEREFIIFGNYFFPQDFIILAVAALVFFLFIALFTVVFGRLWCGWACPQTLFMEMVFRRIEYWIEGDANAQRKLDEAEWTTEKIWKKTAKHVIFALFSLIIGHLVMAYLIGWPKSIDLISQPPTAHLSGFIALMAFSTIFYVVFAKAREQVCVAICPYGRLQSVLLVKESIVVIYDFLRGEPRGKRQKNAPTVAPALGDCIDCKLCVQVCPTGIDIRNGTQLECVNCTACIDACDAVMDKIKQPRGLIRFDSQQGVTDNIKLTFTARIAAYTAVLVVLVGLEGFLLMGRSPIESTVLRVPGMLYQTTEKGMLTNLYNVQIVNKTPEDLVVEPKLKGFEGKISVVGQQKLEVKQGKTLDVVMFIELNPKDLHAVKTKLDIDFYANGKLLESSSTNFMAPAPQK